MCLDHAPFPLFLPQIGVLPAKVPEALGLSRVQLVTVAAHLGTDLFKRDENTITKARAMYRTGAPGHSPLPERASGASMNFC